MDVLIFTTTEWNYIKTVLNLKRNVVNKEAVRIFTKS